MMALHLTSEGGQVRVEVRAASNEEDWPRPIRTGLAPEKRDFLEAVQELPEGAPVVVQLDAGQRYDLDHLAMMARAVEELGRGAIIVVGEE